MFYESVSFSLTGSVSEEQHNASLKYYYSMFHDLISSRTDSNHNPPVDYYNPYRIRMGKMRLIPGD
jgi:hypothetical protein